MFSSHLHQLFFGFIELEKSEIQKDFLPELGIEQCVNLRIVSTYDSTSGRSLLLRLSIVVLEMTKCYAEVIRVCVELLTGSANSIFVDPIEKASDGDVEKSDIYGLLITYITMLYNTTFTLKCWQEHHHGLLQLKHGLPQGFS